ncbi:DUF192 domain-containing protein [Hydrogenophaga sp. T2]|uniref:DUF192 domain-containing protein n=1 Tax=Hydrogenophaga sp. T2 TaxID=3132823 RepID=UPI003CE8FC3D
MAAPRTRAVLHTATGRHPLHLHLADRFLSRARGLLFAPPLPDGQGLLLLRCASVHTGFMRSSIDVVYLDAGGAVLRCVPDLAPWRLSACGPLPRGRGRHTLELAAGSIERLGLRPGDRLEHPLFATGLPRPSRPHTPRRERGATLVEFTVVGPVITLLGLALLQYGLLFFARNGFNHAAFMAARAGAVGNASLASVQAAYVRALVPLYGGGRDSAELAQAHARAAADVAAHTRIELLNPSRASFDDWNDPALQRALGQGRRVIPHANLAFRNPAEVRASSGQNIHDANLIRLRITQGYAPPVPLVRQLYSQYLRWQDPGTDAFRTQLIAAGRIPIVTHVTLQMQSDAIEPDTPSTQPAGEGGGTPAGGGGAGAGGGEDGGGGGADPGPSDGAGDPGGGGSAVCGVAG